MAPKRKRPAAVPEEEPVPKRQLRSRGAPTPTPTSSPTKPKVASRRAQSSPRKRVKQAKVEDVESESSVDELDVISTSLDQGPLAEDRCLSDETNTIRASAPPSLELTDEVVFAKPRAQIGRPRKTQEFKETAPPVDEVTPTGLPKLKGRSLKKRKVEETSSIIEELPSAENIGKLSSAKPKASKGRPRKKQDVQETVSLAEKGPDHQMQQIESVIESEPLDVFSRSMEVDTPTRRRSARSVIEVVLPATTRAKAKASQRSVSLVAEESTSVNEEQHPPTPATISSPSKTTARLKVARVTKQTQPQKIEPERDENGDDDDEEEVSTLVVSSPSRRTSLPEFDPSKDLSGPLPNHLLFCFNAYKRAILKTLHCPNIASSQTDFPSVNDIAAKQLSDLVGGTVLRAEGNSCLLLGPRGSGKSQMVDACLEQVAFNKPIVLCLSGWVQSTDRHALREIAFQLLQQTGTALLPEHSTDTDPLNPDPELDEEENPFLEAVDHTSEEAALTLPPSSQLHALIPILLTLNRPVVVILDAFDLFALHPRQSLLYCLLDTVQNCRASSESRGIAVIGITSRVDTVQLLEKRVKSRFSGRTIRTAPPGSLQTSLGMVKTILQPSEVCDEDEHVEEWKQRWAASVKKFLEDNSVTNVLNETFGVTRDFKVIIRILTTCVLRLTPSQPYLSSKTIFASAEIQRSRPRQMHLNNLSYPSLCLLIACAHADTGGHKSFTFEMLHERFGDQVRALASAPVQFNGGSIGMMRCPREVLISAFEDLIAAKIFVCTIATSSSIAKQFIKCRCAVDRLDIKAIIEKSGNTNLKKWLNKAQ